MWRQALRLEGAVVTAEAAVLQAWMILLTSMPARLHKIMLAEAASRPGVLLLKGCTGEDTRGGQLMAVPAMTGHKKPEGARCCETAGGRVQAICSWLSELHSSSSFASAGAVAGHDLLPQILPDSQIGEERPVHHGRGMPAPGSQVL